MAGSITPPLTDKQKQDWNSFLDFVDKEGFKGSPALDDKDKGLGMYLMQKYRSLNPKVTISYQDVPRVQQALQDYKSTLVDQYKKGLIAPTDSIKNPETDIMGGISPVDGWLGSKTSSYKFPVAQATNADKTATNYGTNTAAFDKDRLAKQ
jgi:hypothetical protein